MSMRILELVIENVKRIKTVVISPKEWMVSVAGSNESGKTSTLDSIMYALKDKSAQPERPLRDGAKSGKIEVKLSGGISIFRSITPGGTGKYEVCKDGVPQTKPLEFLANYFTKDAFDAADFFKMDKVKQRKFLLDLLKIDVEGINAKIKMAYDKRAEVNRKLSDVTIQAKAIQLPPDCPSAEVSVAEMMTTIEQANENNRTITSRRLSISSENDRIREREEKIERLQKEISDIRVAIEGHEMALLSMKEIDVSELRAKAQRIEADNFNARNKIRKGILENAEAEYAKEAESLTRVIQECDDGKKLMIDTAVCPVPGLSFDDDQILYNGLPIDQASDAQRVIIGVSLIAEKIPENGIRILRVRNGSDLDRKSRKIIAEIADKKKVQVWLESVQDEPSTGEMSKYEFYLQDGQVAVSPVTESAV
jgi:recombinational DNA repair ATPase RecF